MSRSKPAVRLMFATILLASLSEPASAELRVVIADGVDAAVGAEYPDDHVFDVADNGTLVVDDLTTKTTYRMGGPYKGTLAYYWANCRGESRASKQCGGTGR